jgi:hypothetical protein
MGCMVPRWPKLPSSKPEAPLSRSIPRPLKTPRSCSHLLAKTLVNRPALTGSFGCKKCLIRPKPPDAGLDPESPRCCMSLSSLAAGPGAPVRVVDPRSMQAECVQGSEDLRQLHVGTMPGSLPTLKVDKYRLGIATTAVPFPRGKNGYGAR